MRVRDGRSDLLCVAHDSPAPKEMVTTQQQTLRSLVDEWAMMSADARNRMLAAIFDSVTASAEGVDRLEPCEDWRPYIVAAIPKPVGLLRAPPERKTGVKHAEVVTARILQDERGWLRLAG